MEWAIMTFGAKFCCIGASGIGGLANRAVKKSISWRDLLLAIFVGWVAAEFFIPPVMKHWELDMTWGPAIAFVIGFCGIRLLPVLEEAITNRVKKVSK